MVCEESTQVPKGLGTKSLYGSQPVTVSACHFRLPQKLLPLKTDSIIDWGLQIWNGWAEYKIFWTEEWPWKDQEDQSVMLWFMSIRTVSQVFNKIAIKFAFRAVRILEPKVIEQDPAQCYIQFKVSKCSARTDLLLTFPEANIISNAQKLYIQSSTDRNYQEEVISIISSSQQLMFIL